MAKDRIYQPVSHTTIHGDVRAPFIAQGAGAAIPVNAKPPSSLGGDPNNAYGSWVRNSAGNYTWTSTDTYTKCLKSDAAWLAATPSSTKVVSCGVPTKNANNTWSLTLLFSVSGTATDLPAGDYVSLDLEFSKSTVLP